MQDSLEWLIGEDNYQVSLKVGSKMLHRNNQYINNLFRSGIPGLYIIKHFAHIVDEPLDFFVIHPNQHGANYRRRCNKVWYSSSPTSGLDNRDRDARNFFSSLKTCRNSFIQVKSFISHGTLKKGKQHSVDQEMKRLSIVTCPISCCTSLLKVGCCISRITWILSSFTSMPCLVTINLRNLSTIMPNMHLLKFSFIW